VTCSLSINRMGTATSAALFKQCSLAGQLTSAASFKQCSLARQLARASGRRGFQSCELAKILSLDATTHTHSSAERPLGHAPRTYVSMDTMF